jgi:hypothetical protein
MKRLPSHNSVVLAVHMLADGEGLACHATNAQLSVATGRAVETVQAALRWMERAGHIVSLGSWDGLPRRMIVLLDHPDARRLIEETRRNRFASVVYHKPRRRKP